jgi:hypothetical protein
VRERGSTDSGVLTLIMKEAGELLQYRNKPAEYVGRLYVSHKDEFDNDCTYMSCIGGDATRPPLRERLFTLDGLILLCMHSEQPVAQNRKTFSLPTVVYREEPRQIFTISIR